MATKAASPIHPDDAIQARFPGQEKPSRVEATVTRMACYARGTEGFFKLGEDERIIQFLSATQNSEAWSGRLPDAPDLSRGRRLPKTLAFLECAEAMPNFPTIAGAKFTTAVFGTLLLRRPKSSSKDVSGAPVSSISTPGVQNQVVERRVNWRAGPPIRSGTRGDPNGQAHHVVNKRRNAACAPDGFPAQRD